MKAYKLILAIVAATFTMGSIQANAEEATTTTTTTTNANNSGQRGERGGPRGERPDNNRAFPGLTQEESTKVREAMKAAQSDATVVAAEAEAKKAREANKDSEDKEAARKSMMESRQKVQEATQAAMIKADPTIEPLLKKMEEARKNQGQRGERGGEGRTRGRNQQ